jgi:hypothetical protein
MNASRATFLHPTKTKKLSGHHRRNQRKNQRGNAILFTLLAMVIGGVLVSVGITQYRDADRAAIVQNTVAEVNSIIGNAKQNYGQYSYDKLSTAIAVGSRVIPTYLSNTAGGATSTTANNKFGGPITLDANPALAGTATLGYAQVPADVCTSLVNGTQGLAEEIKIGATVIKTAGGLVNVANLNAGCTSAPAVIINWTFGRT